MRIAILLSMFLPLVASYNPYSLYLWTQYNQAQEDKTQLVSTCYDILIANGLLPQVLHGYIAFLAQTKQFKELLKIRHMIPADEVNSQILIAQAYEGIGQPAQADALLIKLTEKHPYHIEVVYYGVAAYARQRQTEKALATIDTYLAYTQDSSKNFLFYFLKAQLLVKNNQPGLAQESAQKVVELNPSFEQGWLLLGLLAEQAGDYTKATTAYKSATFQNKDSIADQQLQTIAARQQYTVHAIQQELLNKAITLFEQKNYQPALELVNKSLELADNPTAKLLKIELLCRLGKIEDALDWIREWIEINPKDTHWYEALSTLEKSGVKFALIEKTLLSLTQRIKQESNPALYLGKLYAGRGNTQSALLFYQKALQSTQDTTQVQTIQKLIQSIKEH